jgi:addiction module HigA family antidote
MATTAIHPGEHLAEELKILGMSAAELARKVDVPTNRITQILNGDRSITGDTALRLAPCAWLWHQPGILAELTEPL